MLKTLWRTCDIGTTTVVCYLIDKETGQIISTRSGANPQRSFGADVLSRIDAAARADDNDKANGGLQMMQTQIVSLLNGWISEMLTECGRTKVSRIFSCRKHSYVSSAYGNFTGKAWQGTVYAG